MCSLRSLRSIFLGSGIIDRSDRAREHAPSETDVRDCLGFQVVYRSRRCDRFPMMHSPQEQLPVCGSGGSNKLLVLCIGGFWVSVMKILIFYHHLPFFHNSILIIAVIGVCQSWKKKRKKEPSSFSKRSAFCVGVSKLTGICLFFYRSISC